MLIHNITYTNFNGQEVTKPFYFNITKGELAIRELESDGTWTETLQRIKDSNQGSVVMPEFKKIIKWTYGQKSEDGESFEKSDAIWAKFENSEAWSVLIMDLLTKENFASEFINGVMPADIAARNRESQATPGFRPGADTSRPGQGAHRGPEPELTAYNGEQGVIRQSTPVTDQGSAGAQQGNIEQVQ